MLLTTLTTEQLQSYTPSAFAATPWEGMSSKYRMIPTIEVVRHLQDHGFAPVQAMQGRTRIPGKADFTRHVIKFTNVDMDQVRNLPTRNDHPWLVEPAPIPMIVLSNAHDGTSAYKVSLGMYRLLCLNGLMVCSGDIDEVSVRHTGSESLAHDVLEASYKIIDEAPIAMRQVEDWTRRELTKAQQLAYADAALELVGHTLKPTPEQAIAPRRTADQSTDMWTTLNVVQENLIRGGQRTRNAQGQRRHVRAIKSLNEDVRLNRALWKLTEALAAQI